MSERGIGIGGRTAFCLCSLATIVNTLPYALLRGVDLPRQSEWIWFVGLLGPVGLCSLAAAVLPRSWIGSILGITPQSPAVFTSPLKSLIVGALVGYVVAASAHSIPNRWNVNPQLLLPICPLYFVKMTFDPKPAETFVLLAPLNAGLYGALGMLVGYFVLASHKFTNSRMRHTG